MEWETLLGVVAGGVLTGGFAIASQLTSGAGVLLSEWLTGRAQHREAIGLLLRAVLELRHIQRTQVHLLRTARKLFGTQPGDALLYDQITKNLVRDGLPDAEKYESAVAAITGSHPDLAYRLSGLLWYSIMGML